jgi:hypothetical protein
VKRRVAELSFWRVDHRVSSVNPMRRSPPIGRTSF